MISCVTLQSQTPYTTVVVKLHRVGEVIQSLKRLWHPTGQKAYLVMQVIFVINKLDVETQKPDSEAWILFSFIYI